MSEEKLYQFNEYVLGYDKGHNDRSCLTISKIQNDIMYVMSSLYDGSADVISLMLDSLQEELRQTKLLKEKYQLKKDKQKEVLDKIKEYIETHKVSDTISFPLMKKDEEQQVKNCFDYEFNETYKKDLDKILEEIE